MGLFYIAYTSTIIYKGEAKYKLIISKTHRRVRVWFRYRCSVTLLHM